MALAEFASWPQEPMAGKKPGVIGLVLAVLLVGCARAASEAESSLVLPPDHTAFEADVRGMLMYRADAPVLRECTTGDLFPVRMEAAWLETERAYLALDEGAHPGWVRVEGAMQFEWGQPMEGAERWQAIFPQVPELARQRTCGQSTEQILDREWTITHLDGFPPERFAEGHRPTAKVTEDPDTTDGTFALSGSTGCNRYGGSASLDGDRLAGSDIAATRMYCMNTADIESRFLEVLEAAAFGSLEGDRWVWYDASGQRLAEFSADP